MTHAAREFDIIVHGAAGGIAPAVGEALVRRLDAHAGPTFAVEG